MMLLSGEADFAIIFGTTADELLSASPTFTEVTLQSETLLPVASEEFVSETKPHWEHEGIPIIGTTLMQAIDMLVWKAKNLLVSIRGISSHPFKFTVLG